MTGINNTSGKHLEGIAHLKQSCTDILTTPLGSRVMRRTYGSKIFKLIDAPLNAGTIVDLFAASAEALNRWEPRFKLEKIKAVNSGIAGKIELDLSGKYLPDGKDITMNGIIV
jgi:hypothetical protein